MEQSPAKSMQDALSPLMKALVKEDLLKHSDVDVKVAVASCISEITRITAPEAPYDDEKMKVICFNSPFLALFLSPCVCIYFCVSLVGLHFL